MKQRYDSYKPSGIDWIGDIPSHWEKSRLKHYISIDSGDYISKDQISDEGKIPVFGGGEQIGFTEKNNVSENSLIIGRVGARCGCVTPIIGRAWATDNSLICVPKDSFKFLFYLLLAANLNKLNESNAQPLITATKVKNLIIGMPPLSEQEAIATWLDKKCGEIDAAIAKVDREIELIDELKQSEISRVVTRGLNPDAPLRHSGIDWIGDIPKHWEKCRFKNFMQLRTKPSDSERKIGLENIESGSGRYIESETEFEGNGMIFYPNDILYGKLRPYLRKVWKAEFEGNAIGDFFIFRNLENSIPSYLKYLLLSDGFTKQADGSTYGAKMPRVASEFIMTLPFYIPPLSEQQSIADYLDKKCAEIDGLKAKLTKKRETLKELRQSIISEVVTGKRKVL